MRLYQKSNCFSELALTIPFPLLFPDPALTIPFPVNKFPNKLTPTVPNNIIKNPPFCYFVSFSIVSVNPFKKILESSRACTIFTISFISTFEIIKVAFPVRMRMRIRMTMRMKMINLVFLIYLQNFCCSF